LGCSRVHVLYKVVKSKLWNACDERPCGGDGIVDVNVVVELVSSNLVCCQRNEVTSADGIGFWTPFRN
jgi:hypothetical protein